MPNECWNRITVYHDNPKMLTKAFKEFKNENLLNHFIPIPEDNHTIDWCNENWGTKWDTNYPNVLYHADDQFAGTFMSAWAPPIAAYDQLQELGFRIDAIFMEPSLGVFGTYLFGLCIDLPPFKAAQQAVGFWYDEDEEEDVPLVGSLPNKIEINRECYLKIMKAQ